MARGTSLYDAELKPSALCDNLEGGMEEEMRGFKREGTYVYYGWFMLMCGRNEQSILQLKINIF